MKNLIKLFGFISIIAIIACAMAACDPQENDQTPVADDYVIGNLKQEADSVTAVTIMPKQGKSSGKITIYYEGIGDTAYTKSTVVPAGASGSSYAVFSVTFDVAAASGWKEAKGLFAGLLTIGSPTPVASDYEVNGLWQTFGKVNAVTITPRAGKSPGARTIYYEGTGSTTYTKSTTLPTARGTYAVTFDVAAATIWKAATGLSAGTLEINDKPTPVADDYEISGLTQSAGSAAAVTITPKADKSSGARTIYYAGTGSTNYAKSTTLPTAVGSYAVTFDIAAAEGWNPATGLSAGTLVLNTNQTPVAGDYEIGGLWQTYNKVNAVTITPKSGKSPGARTIYYEGTGSTTYTKGTTLPTAKGKYAVTFDVATASGWNPATGLTAGTLDINDNETPVADDYTIDNLEQSVGSVSPVTITKKPGKSPGAVSNIKYAGNAALPTAAGTYAVTFDVAAAAGWNPAAGLPAGNLVISSTQTQTISAEIIGTPEVGKKLTADVKKNFAGELLYQWYANGQEIRGEDYYIFFPMPTHSGKQITVKVTCKTANGDKSATSPAVTIPAVQWTPSLEQYGNRLYAQVEVGEFTFAATEEGFSTEWFRNGEKFANSNGYYYDIIPAVDAEKKISVKITGYGATKTSAEISVPPVVVPVIPEPTIEWHKIATVTPTEILKEMAWNIERAYDGNVNDCKVVIDSKREGGAWCIDFYTDEEDEDAQIVDGKLRIHISTIWYEGLIPMSDLQRQSYIGQKLAYLAGMAQFISEYSGNFEDIHMAKLAKPEPNATVTVTDFS